MMATYLIRDLAIDIEIVLSSLEKLEGKIQEVQQNIEEAPVYASDFYQSLAFKLHEFYTGCEYIFNLVLIELDSETFDSAGRQEEMLSRMAMKKSDRKAVLTLETAEKLKDFSEFRQAVRNLYGFELETDRIDQLSEQYPFAWASFEKDVRAFVDWLRELAIALDS